MKDEPVVLINAFEVSSDDDEAFIAGWMRAREFMQAQPGYLSSRLHQSLSPDAKFRFVNIAQWESTGAFDAALARREFQSVRSAFQFHAALYRTIVPTG